jgi:hypothetical protein
MWLTSTELISPLLPTFAIACVLFSPIETRSKRNDRRIAQANLSSSRSTEMIQRPCKNPCKGSRRNRLMHTAEDHCSWLQWRRLQRYRGYCRCTFCLVPQRHVHLHPYSTTRSSCFQLYKKSTTHSQIRKCSQGPVHPYSPGNGSLQRHLRTAASPCCESITIEPSNMPWWSIIGIGGSCVAT